MRAVFHEDKVLQALAVEGVVVRLRVVLENCSDVLVTRHFNHNPCFIKRYLLKMLLHLGLTEQPQLNLNRLEHVFLSSGLLGHKMDLPESAHGNWSCWDVIVLEIYADLDL